MPEPDAYFYRRQEFELAALTEDRVKQLLRILESVRANLQLEISDLESFEERRLLVLLEQIDAMARDAELQIRRVGPVDKALGHMVQRHSETNISQLTGFDIALPLNLINPEVIQRFAFNELEKVTGLTRMELKTVKNILLNRVGVKGENPRAVARNITGKHSPFRRRFGHIETILRTETATVYNAQSVNAVKAANENYSLALNKRIIETIDNKRNHPISQVLNDQVAPTDSVFRASIAAVERKAAALGKSSGGIFWSRNRGFYEGDKLPAHYRDRGIVTATQREVNVP